MLWKVLKAVHPCPALSLYSTKASEFWSMLKFRKTKVKISKSKVTSSTHLLICFPVLKSLCK